MAITRSIDHWGRWQRAGLTHLSMWTLCAIVVLMVVDVTGRKFFDRPLLGGVELVEQMLLLSVYAAIPLVSQARGHVSIELFDAIFPPTWHRLRQALGEVFCAALMLGCAWLVGQHALESWANGDTTTLLRISLWPLECLVTFLLLCDGLSHLGMAWADMKGESQ